MVYQDAVLAPHARELVLGRITTAGAISSRPLSLGARPISLAIGPDGALWYASWSGVVDACLGRITANDIRELPLPGMDLARAALTGPDGALWLAFAPGIGRIDTSGKLRIFRLRVERSPTDIVTGPDRALWFSEDICGCIGRMTTAGHVRTFRLPQVPNCRGALAVGAGGAIWFTHPLGLATPIRTTKTLSAARSAGST